MLRPIVVIQKKDHFGLRYKLDKRDRQRLTEKKKEKRMDSFLEKKKKCKVRNPIVELFFHLRRFCQSLGNPMQGQVKSGRHGKSIWKFEH